jgi:hypothetical protein
MTGGKDFEAFKAFGAFEDEAHAGDAGDVREVLRAVGERGEAGGAAAEVGEVGAVGEVGGSGEGEQLRALLAEAAPEFPVTVALGDRALAGAARRRVRVRGLGGIGVVALVAVGVVAVAPLAGWGGRGSGAAPDRFFAGAVATTTGAPTLAPPAPSRSAPLAPSPDSTHSTNPVSVTEAKVEAETRVMNALKSGHENSYMGVGVPMGQPDASPIIVYRKPYPDPTLEGVAKTAALPYTVVFHDTVLNASEQWFLGHQMQQDMSYWKGQSVVFGTALQEDGTITVYTPDPAKVVPLLEQHYGYDGRVFVGQEWGFAPPGVNSTGS